MLLATTSLYLVAYFGIIGFGIWDLVFDVQPYYGIWYMVFFGIWYLVFSIRYLVYIWYLVKYLVFGIWDAQ